VSTPGAKDARGKDWRQTESGGVFVKQRTIGRAGHPLGAGVPLSIREKVVRNSYTPPLRTADMVMQHQSISKAPLFALIAVGTIFCWIVGYGWFRTFTTWGNTVSAYVAGILIPPIGMALAYAVAYERRKGNIAIPLGFFFILFLISAAGTINTLFFQMRGLISMQEEIEAARTSLVNLNGRSKQILGTPDHETYERRVWERWEPLKAEIENPQRCGQGPEAAKRIAELQQVLPAFKPLSGGGCEHSTRVVAQYQKTIAQLLTQSATAQAARPLVEAKDEIDRTLKNTLETLDHARAALKDVSDISAAVKVVQDAAATYVSMREKAERVSGKSTDTPANIPTRSALGIGNLGEVLKFVVKKWDLTTAFFVFIAVLLDVALILAFKGILADTSTSTLKSTVIRPPIATLRNY